MGESNRKDRADSSFFAEGIGGTALFYERMGCGLPLVLCDGFLCDGYIWKYLVKNLSDRCEFIHWHYPGHGQSGEPERFSALSPVRLADDAERVIDSAGLNRCILVGHSMGVQVALETWHRHPESVAALILLCGSPGKIVRDFHESEILGYLLPILDLFEKFAPKLPVSIWKRLPARRLVWLAKRLGEVDPRLMNTADLDQYLSRVNRVSFSVALRMLEGAGRHDATPYLNEIGVPTLVIGGENDRFTPTYRSELMATSIPQAELTIARGGTHTLPIEQPDLVSLRIRRFLEQRFSSTTL